LKEEALAHTLWRTLFGRGNGPLLKTVCKTNEWASDI